MRTDESTKNVVVLVTFCLTITASLMIGSRETKRDDFSLGGLNYPVRSDPAITITSDAQLSAYPGNGSEVNPYTIANFSILLESGTAISIANTRMHVLIKNCTVRTSTGAVTHFGIKINNASNVRLEENVGYKNYYGIYLNNCSDMSISRNNLSATIFAEKKLVLHILGPHTKHFHKR
nr:DUF1565 domain-containing protein [Candidatus Sigynarchaeota archaeon]